MIIRPGARPRPAAALALLPHSPAPYITLMLVGFVVGILGHLTRARWLVAAGVILIFLGAFLFPWRQRDHREPAAADRGLSAAP